MIANAITSGKMVSLYTPLRPLTNCSTNTMTAIISKI